ncbi:metal-dependent hydrolase family protein [Amphiplicatus metriothermophilus]|uniref:Pro-Hyp dipeptidase. Metallo peptidase. MEROPS family M38 n=1 Tax=Amphiplicatus metriothermophilus TaxID=1519374 RepID=A0A239PJB3_9PROT|nr:amidohydrolase family protein [Amphiplicatus metriothermophilus]MBB5517798.1 imidazolonepropionase-like amidohydrolase [Amphiplicatus metriothermophilus]SNT67868.1 Pro-Hyp dipeptidase. Metallo peptidase. MEROPS family M38 [Amphiplicatus metriothermophilus]
MRNRFMRFIAAAVFTGGAFAAGAATAADIVIVHAGRLLAVPGRAPASEQSVVIRDGKVAAVMDGYVDAAGAGAEPDDATRVYDLKDYFVLPGLIDGHVHLTNENNPKGRLQTVELSDPDRAILAAGFARKTLEAGFTTVRDVGARGGDAIFALRDGIERGDVVGPRIFASGDTISVTGGHGDGTQGYRDDVAEILHSSGVCDGVAECRKAVREQVRRGADHIKLTATAGVLSNTAAGLDQQFFEDELRAVVETAHMMARKATAHAHGVDGINAALRAGVDSIEHGTYLDDESIRLFRRTGAYLVPTVLAGVTVAEWAADPESHLLPPQRAKAAEVGPRMLDMARRAHRGGVKIAFGTDSGVSRHGENAREFALLVEAGMTPMEAIVAATVNGADNLGKADMLGTLEPGKLGDLIAVDGDPLADIRELEDVDFVMKEGVVYKTAAPQAAQATD